MRPAPERPAGHTAFAYPEGPHERRHGPAGYADDADYKPWLRDEFDFRCVYCLCREIWLPTGASAFSVEHLRAVSVAPPRPADYNTLAFACCQCNSSRGAAVLPLDPCDGLRGHLAVLPDGGVRPLTLLGAAFIRICHLGRPELVAFRRLLHDILAVLESGGGFAAEAGRRYLAYPDELPDLSTLRPPGGNTRPEGIGRSAFARRSRGELPEAY